MQTTDKSPLFVLKRLVASPEHKGLNPSRFNPSCFLVIFANYPFMHFFQTSDPPRRARRKLERVRGSMRLGRGVKTDATESVREKCKHDRSRPRRISRVSSEYCLNYVKVLSPGCVGETVRRQCATNISGHR